VIDGDMGAKRRTSQNLSGGETFLLSLALALGLSRMGGSNLKVDTLFLDEGFGTLDEETLSHALGALERLHAAKGKLIGVISHVQGVRERIATHITVSPRAGSGRSTLSGPGVRRLSGPQ
jgi:exonuclease SbcC